MNSFRENIASALRALRENWLRTALTMLGIVIGVGSVVLLVGIGQGVEIEVASEIESLGANVVVVVPGKLDRNGQPNFMATLGISPLTERDVADLRRMPGIAACAPVMFTTGTVERGKRSYSAFVLATNSDFQRMRKQAFTAGRFFTPAEAQRPVCVLADEPKQEIFGSSPGVGQTINVRGASFQIVGTLAPEEDSLFGSVAGSFNNIIYLALPAARRAFGGQGQLNRIFLLTDYRVAPEPVLAAVRAKLLSNHGTEDFGIITMKQLLGTIFKVFNIVKALLAGISAISLVVAGIGIMNIMLVTVTERTREIGIRKTVGARNRDIFLQFLTEAVVLAVVGGILGTVLAAAICRALALYTPLKPAITPPAVAMAFTVCFAVGLIFGVAPAMRAARQDPIQALRWE